MIQQVARRRRAIREVVLIVRDDNATRGTSGLAPTP